MEVKDHFGAPSTLTVEPQPLLGEGPRENQGYWVHLLPGDLAAHVAETELLLRAGKSCLCCL